MEHFLENLSNQTLLARLETLVQRNRTVEVELLTYLGEVDARRLYLEEGYSSMFLYCVRGLHFSEAIVYGRIRAARTARCHPEILEALRRGDLHVTAVSLIAARLTEENCVEWIQLAEHKTAEEIKRFLADKRPKPSVADCLRRIPTPAISAPATQALLIGEPAKLGNPVIVPTAVCVKAKLPADGFTPVQSTGRVEIPMSGKTADVSGKQKAVVDQNAEAPLSAMLQGEKFPLKPASHSAPLGGERYRVCFTADGELHAQLLELRALMRHQIPNGDIGKILGRAVAFLLREIRKRKFGEVLAPRFETPAMETPQVARIRPVRSISAVIRRVVFQRDGGRCSYVSPQGRRCDSRDFLEFHHVTPWARTQTHSVEGIALRCRAHNQYHARRDFGEKHMERFRKP